jgi:RNase P/RNase MRP subunit p29
MAVAPVQKKSKKWLLILAVIVVIAVIAVVVGLALGGTSTPAKSAAAKSTATKQKAAATAPEEEQEFDSTVLGVTATYPLSWTVTDADGPVPSFLVATNTPDDIQTPISTTAVIVVSKEVSDKSASTYAQKIIDDNIQTIGTTFTVVSQSTKKVAGQDAVVVNSTYTANKIASKEQDIVIVKEGTAYRMSFATAADQWSKNQSVFDTFLKTVTFDQKT